MLDSPRIKGGTTAEAFQEQCFQWERGASVDADFYLKGEKKTKKT